MSQSKASQIPKAPPPMMSMRGWIMAGFITAITVTGVWYGAGLKTQQEVKQETKTYAEASADEQIQQLQGLRARLATERDGLQKKLLELRAASR